MLVLLIGPKGSGKSYLGRLLDSKLGVHFFPVESHLLAYHADCQQAGREPTIADGMKQVHPAIKTALTQHRHVCVETTGASREILDDLMQLNGTAETLLVKVSAPLSLCLERIAKRDPSAHIPIDTESICKVYELSQQLSLPFHLILENQALTPDAIISAFAPRLQG